MATIEDVLSKLTIIEDKISENTSQLLLFNGEISKLRSEFENNSKFTTTAIINLQDKQTSLETSQEFIGKQFDAHKAIIENVMKKNKQLEDENKKINNVVKRLQEHLKEETIKRDELEAYGRRTCIELVGLPITENENCQNLAVAVAKLMKMDAFSKNEIDVAHRVSQKDNANIIVKFKSRSARDSFFVNRQQLKGMTVHKIYEDLLAGQDNASAKDHPYYGNTNKNFVNESLTPAKKNLFWKARTKTKELGWTGLNKNGRCWTKNGLIFAQENKVGGTSILKLRHEYDLEKIK